MTRCVIDVIWCLCVAERICCGCSSTWCTVQCMYLCTFGMKQTFHLLCYKKPHDLAEQGYKKREGKWSHQFCSSAAALSTTLQLYERVMLTVHVGQRMFKPNLMTIRPGCGTLSQTDWQECLKRSAHSYHHQYTYRSPYPVYYNLANKLPLPILCRLKRKAVQQSTSTHEWMTCEVWQRRRQQQDVELSQMHTQ